MPYTYTLAQQTNATGVPIIRPLYLNYPDNSEAYTNSREYLYGDNVLVAPITSPNDASGNGSVSAWIPPGTWTDYFTGTTYTGPSTATITDSLAQMPVLIKSGGVMPARTDYVDNAAQTPLTQLTVNVAAGANGSFSLYQDAGEGTGYQSGQSTSTPISWNDATRTLTVGATTGSYLGAPTQRSYILRLSNAAAPTAVDVDGAQVPETAWAYNPNRRVVTVVTPALPVAAAHTVTLTGSATANPTSGEVIGTGGLCLDVPGSTAANGQPVQLSTCNHTAAQEVTYTGANTLQILGKCVDVQSGGTGNGTAIQLFDCNGSGAQTWVLHANGALVNPQSGRCLDDPGGTTTPGAVQLQIYDCNNRRRAGLAASPRTGQWPRRPVRRCRRRRSGFRHGRAALHLQPDRRAALVGTRRRHAARVRQVPGRPVWRYRQPDTDPAVRLQWLGRPDLGKRQWQPAESAVRALSRRPRRHHHPRRPAADRRLQQHRRPAIRPRWLTNLPAALGSTALSFGPMGGLRSLTRAVTVAEGGCFFVRSAFSVHEGPRSIGLGRSSRTGAGFVTLPCREREVSAPQELLGSCDCSPPRCHRDTAKRAVRLGGDGMALDVEGVVDGGVG